MVFSAELRLKVPSKYISKSKQGIKIALQIEKQVELHWYIRVKKQIDAS